MANTLQEYNRRQLIKRSSVSSVVPTIPSGVTDVYDHTAGGWLDTDLYVGEMFLNIADNRAWFRSDTGIVELASVSGYSSFLDLTDTPGTYTGQTNKLVAVNASGTGLEFIDNTTVTSILDLSDTPTGLTNDTVLVGNTITGEYESQPYINTFGSLIDVSGYTGNAGKLYKVNVTETGLDAFEGSDLFLTLSTNQNITGNKNFSGTTTCDDLIANDFTIGSVTIDSIITDSGLTTALDTNIATTKAVKDYVDDKVIIAVGGSYVSLTGNEIVNGEKRWGNEQFFYDGVNVKFGDVKLANGDLTLDLTSYHYYGAVNIDGSYRTFINPLGYLETQKRESGVWVFKNQI